MVKEQEILSPKFVEWLPTTEKCGEDGWYPTQETITGILLPEYYRTLAKPETDDRNKKLQVILRFCHWICETADDGLDDNVRNLLISFLAEETEEN